MGRGRLKIFLGAAPGVGKTYEMLVQARRRKLDGVDVVIGVVETHGRVETDLLTKGIETVPKRRVPYKGRVLAEMDLDAILQRRPRLALVDELAHDNAPSSRHPKRYQDVEELLAAGIDVYSTLNVQHLESLNDIVAKITKVRVRETVPDSILDRADDIELVDLTPEDLLQRMKDGKVYMADQLPQRVQAQAARHHRIAFEMTFEEPEVGMNVEFGDDLAFAVRPAIVVDGGDAVEHQHRGHGQLRIAGTEQLTAGAGQQALKVKTGFPQRLVHFPVP